MGISIISNFDVNFSGPIDNRMVATTSSDRDLIQYKYVGLKVYVINDQLTYSWNGTSWAAEGRGIYGGSGSLVGDTYVNTGTVGSSLYSKSNIFYFLANTSTTQQVSLGTMFNRTSSGSNDANTIEIQQRMRWNTGSGFQEGPLISWNPETTNINEKGGIAFTTGWTTAKEFLRISGSGRVGIHTNNPVGDYTYLQIGGDNDPSAYSGQVEALVFYMGGNAIIGYNWYYSGGNQYFDATKGSSLLSQSNGEFSFQVRTPNSNTINPALYISNDAKIGIGSFNTSILPQAQVHIKTSNSSISGRIERTGSSTGFVEFGTENNGLLIYPGGYLNSTLAKWIWINSNGFVGIGVNPVYKLHVDGGSSQAVKINTNAPSSWAAEINNTNNLGSGLVIRSGGTGVSTTTTSYAQLLCLDSSGNYHFTVDSTGVIVGAGKRLESNEAITTLSSALGYVNISLNGAFDGQSVNGGTDNGWDLSNIKATRVGNLVTLHLNLVRPVGIQYASSSGPFYGIQLAISGARFRPKGQTFFGHGVYGYDGDYTRGPSIIEAFVRDSTSFWVRFNTLGLGSIPGAGIRDVARTNIRFRGSVTFVADTY